MPSDWYAGVTLIDEDEKKTSLRFVIGTITDVAFAAEAGQARTRFDDLLTDLKAITDANVYQAFLRCEDPGDWLDSGLPSSADVSDEAVIVVHTNDSLMVTEVDQLRVPAPVAGVWTNNEPSQGIDKTDSALQAYVANYETAFMFSDGEHVNLSEGTAGIADGYWRSVKKSIK